MLQTYFFMPQDTNKLATDMLNFFIQFASKCESTYTEKTDAISPPLIPLLPCKGQTFALSILVLQ